MPRNNKDFKEASESRPADMPGFEGTWASFDSLIKKGNAIVEKRKSNEE